MVNYTGTPFLSIKDTAKATGLSIYYLRQGVKAEEIAHIKSGKKILINVPLLLNKLEGEAVSK